MQGCSRLSYWRLIDTRLTCRSLGKITDTWAFLQPGVSCKSEQHCKMLTQNIIPVHFICTNFPFSMVKFDKRTVAEAGSCSSLYLLLLAWARCKWKNSREKQRERRGGGGKGQWSHLCHVLFIPPKMTARLFLKLQLWFNWHSTWAEFARTAGLVSTVVSVQ